MRGPARLSPVAALTFAYLFRCLPFTGLSLRLRLCLHAPVAFAPPSSNAPAPEDTAVIGEVSSGGEHALPPDAVLRGRPCLSSYCQTSPLLSIAAMTRQSQLHNATMAIFLRCGSLRTRCS